MQDSYAHDEERHEVLYAQEFTHRAGNMLQVAIAALNYGHSDGERGIAKALDVLTGTADLHRLLTGTRIPIVDLEEFLLDVCDAMRRSLGKQADVEICVFVPTLPVVAEDAMKVAMMIAELVGNSMRHAFQDGGGWITVEADDDGIRTDIIVQDDGICKDWTRSGGQGRGIVDAIAGNLGGSARRSITEKGSLRVDIALPSIAAAAQPFEGSA
jgi:two-component sensor histidine kinase